MIDTSKYTIDLHTHSTFSYDGDISEHEYKRILADGILDVIAITDHNETQFAKKLHDQLGDAIIVGEEVMTTEGEMIGLFLQETVRSDRSVKETAESIHKQGGLVYIPHPFETRRKGLSETVLEKIIAEIDIVEVFNGRIFFQDRSAQAQSFTNRYNLSPAASSDAHGFFGIGKTFTTISQIPTHKTLKDLLRNGETTQNRAPFSSLLYPAINKIKHRLVQ